MFGVGGKKVASPRHLLRFASFKSNKFNNAFRDAVVFEDNHLLVVNKPGGCLTQGDKTGDTSLFAEAKQYLAGARKKDLSTVYLALVHRLDRVSSGVVVFGKTSKAASRLSEQFRLRTTAKHYVCVVNGSTEKNGAEHLQNMLRSNAHNKVFISDEKSRHHEAKKAHLVYETVGDIKQNSRAQSLLWVRPTTGRKHQIRVQLSHIGHPIVGDIRYGAPQIFKTPVRDIALHALALEISHPVTSQRMTFTCTVPSYWESRFCPTTVQQTERIAKILKKKDL